jgi:predicted MPP superfamily phosphohydrolase
MDLSTRASAGAAPALAAVAAPALAAVAAPALAAVAARLGHDAARRRLALEAAHEASRLARARRPFPLENWHKTPAVIRAALRLTGLYGRGRRNTHAWVVREHAVVLPHLPRAFDGFTILHLSDLHIDLAPDFVARLTARVHPLAYDLCVLTGDYRARTVGPFAAALAALGQLRAALRAPCHAVLGNHDSLRMVPPMEAMGYRVLLNEATAIARGDARVHLAGVDDAHHYRGADVARAAAAIPRDAVSILLSHTPETYAHAAAAGFDLFLCGHTHGGQICLPGGVPLVTEARSPRRLARGAWRHDTMVGYTSVGAGASIVPVRLNCPPEITLHRLRAA